MCDQMRSNLICLSIADFTEIAQIRVNGGPWQDSNLGSFINLALYFKFRLLVKSLSLCGDYKVLFFLFQKRKVL